MILYPPQKSGLLRSSSPASIFWTVSLIWVTWVSEYYQLGFIVWQRLALRRAESTGLAFDWPLGEVIVAFFGVDFGHDSSDSDLPVQGRPVERNRDFAVVRDFVSFGAFIVGEENESSSADFFQQNEAVVGEAVLIDSAETHHVGFDSFLDGSGLGEPLLELLERVIIETLDERSIPCARTGRCGTLCARF